LVWTMRTSVREGPSSWNVVVIVMPVPDSVHVSLSGGTTSTNLGLEA